MSRTQPAIVGLAVAGLATVGGLLLASSAWAQNAPIRSTLLPPLQKQWQQEDSPSVPQGPVSSYAPGQDTTGPAVPAPGLQDQEQDAPASPAVTQPAPVQRPNIWVPAGVAKLQALDKVNAQGRKLTIKVGQSATFGSLTIMVKSCMIRPSNQPADAAAYLAITDNHPDSSGFDGWMLEDEPSVSMMENPIYDVRVIGCA